MLLVVISLSNDVAQDLPTVSLTLDVYKNPVTVMINSNFTNPVVEHYRNIVKNSGNTITAVPNLEKSLMEIVS